MREKLFKFAKELESNDLDKVAYEINHIAEYGTPERVEALTILLNHFSE